MTRPIAVLVLAFLGGCGTAAESSEDQESDDALEVASKDHAPTCTVGDTKFTFAAYEAPELALVIGPNTVVLRGASVAFRKWRYQNAEYRVDVYKGLGSYETYLFRTAPEKFVVKCVMN